MDKLYEIAVGAAKGLEYLHHHCRQRIIHYDIKPDYVLLDSNFCPKLAYFGVGKLYDTDITHVNLSRHGGTPGYAAPELWMPFPVTYKCDVYSFGMMLLEIIGWRRNLDFAMNESREWFPKRVWEKFDKGELEGMMRDSGMEEKDMEKVKKMCMVALWCVCGVQPHLMAAATAAFFSLGEKFSPLMLRGSMSPLLMKIGGYFGQ